MEISLRKVLANTAENNVTICIKTHRDSPQYYKEDNIVLRNMIREAEAILSKKLANDKSLMNKLFNSLHKIADEIDHGLNLEGLVVFVNENIATYIRIPIEVENRVSVSNKFIVRDIIRTLYSNSMYYIFYLSLKESYLFKVFNDRPVEAIEKEFSSFISEEPIGKSNNRSIEYSSKELNNRSNFFTQINKSLNEAIDDASLPILICSEDSTAADFMNTTNLKDRIIGSFNFEYKKSKNIDLHIAEAAWPIMQEYNKKNTHDKVTELEAAINNNEYNTDINDIRHSINKNRGRTLFIKTNYYLPVFIEDNIIYPVKEEDRNKEGVIDDIISEFILMNLEKGGDTVFLSDDTLNSYNGLVLTLKN